MGNIFQKWFGNPKSNKDSLGLEGEKAAAKFLRKKGFKILVTRYRSRYGEIDLVARNRDTLIFIEVKTRTSMEHGDPFEAVNLEKQRHFSRTALDYLRKIQNPDIPIRFDIVEAVSSSQGFSCNHIQDAFSLSDPYLY